MAVQPQTPYKEYTANGSTKSFSLGFDCESQDHLIVLVDGVEPVIGTWSLSGGAVVFGTAPTTGKKVTIQRNTPASRSTNYKSTDNSFRPDPINKDFDRIWLKLQELGVSDWILSSRIDALKKYVDDRDDELRSYLMEEIRKQGVALDQLDEYYNYLMQRLAQIAVDKGWDASFIVDGDKTQKQINDNQKTINSRTATPYDHGAIGDGLAHPLSERYATLAAAQAVYPSATSLDEYIDGHAVNAWWRDLCANDRKYATCHGKFVCNTKISNVGLNDLYNIIKTRRIDFNADMKFVGLKGNGFEIISPRQCEFTGFVNIYDQSAAYDNRNIDNLFYMEDFIHGVFRWKVVAKNAKNLGLYAYSGEDTLSGGRANNNTSDLGEWQFGSCGHRFKHHNYTFTSRTDEGSSGSTGQRTVLTLSAPHGLGDLFDSIIRFKGKPYVVTNSTINTVTVFPWLKELDATGTIEISKGGDFRLIGADSNNIKISGGSSDCAICAGDEGFYVGAKIQRTNQASDIGLRLGNNVSNSQIGGTYLGLYCELHEFDIVKTSVTVDQPIIINSIATQLSKSHVLAPIDLVTREPSAILSSPWQMLNGDKTYKQRKGQYYTGENTQASVNAKLGDEDFKMRSNMPIITLQDNSDVRRIFGTCDIAFEIFGTATNNGTSGITTIKHESGYTINGISGDFIIPISNSSFKVSARLVKGTDWRISIYYSGRKLESTVVYDPAPLAANEIKYWNITMTGAIKGDAVVASFNGSLNGTILLDAQVTSNNLVTVYHWNPTAAAVDVESGNLTVKLV